MSPPKPTRVPAVRLINALGTGMTRLGLRLPSLEPERLLTVAHKATGLTDFGGQGWREGYDILLASLREESQLSTLGRIMARTQVLGYLKNRLLLSDFRNKHPDVEAQEVRRPIFILGVPRTGTTVLFNLLAQDPANRAPLAWEVESPCPPPERSTYENDPRIRAMQKNFDNLYRLEPNLAPIHMMAARLPQECVAILGHEFMSVQFHVQFNTPSYQTWLDSQSYVPAYRTHKRFLQHLQYRHPAERWVLKSPGHLSAIEDLFAVYPDALIIHTHRDPIGVLPSLASLSYTLRGLASDAVDPAFVGRQQADLWQRHLQRAVEAREKFADKSSQFFDTAFIEVAKDPVGMIVRIYDHFGLTLTEDARSRMEAFLASNPRDKQGVHSYTLEGFGLDRAEVAPRFAEYCARFGIVSGNGNSGR